MSKDFMSDWLGAKSRKTRPADRSRYTVRYDKYDHEDVQRMLEEMPDFDAYRERLIESKAGDLAYEVWQDLYLSLWKVDPRALPDHEIQPEYIINSVVMEEAQKLPDHAELRNWTVGDDIGTALACNTLEPDMETLYDRLEQEVEMAKQLQKQLAELAAAQDEERDLDDLIKQWTEDNPEEELDPDLAAQQQAMQDRIAELDGDAKDAVQALRDALNKARPSISQAMKKGMKEASKDAQTQAAMADSWGLDPGQLHRLPAKQRMELAQKMNNPKLKKIAELFGSIKRYAFAEQKKKVPWTKEEIHDIELGNDIARMLPSELAKLGDPNRRMLFLKDYVQHNLMQYEMRGYEKIAKGGIVYCHDGSGSMGGDREIWAKAVGLALLHIAKKQNRPFYAIQFGSPGQLRCDDFRDSANITPEKVIDFAEFFFGGGTDFESPLNLAIALLNEEYESEGRTKSDIVFATDGMCYTHDEWLAEFKVHQKKIGFSIWGVIIGGAQESEPLWSITDHKVASIKSLTSGENMKEIFGGI